MIKKIFTVVVLLGLLCISDQGKSQTVSVSKIVGPQGQCDTANTGCVPIPFTQGVVLCASGCAKFVSPSYTDATRFWGTNGSGCRTSSDSGSTWAACTTQPFNSGGKEWFVGTADGAVLGASRGGAWGGTVNDCVFKRSTDNGVTWSAAVVVTNQPCGGALAGGNTIVCLANGTCVLLYADQSTSVAQIVTSTDNGQSWTKTFAGTTFSQANYFIFDGSDGIGAASGAATPAVSYAGGAWAMTANYPAGTTICYGSFIMNGVAYNSCGTSPYTTARIINDSTVIAQSPTLPGYYTGAGVTAPMMISPAPGIIYAAGSYTVTPGSLPIGIWASRDSGVTFGLVYKGTTAANGTQAGSMFVHPINGCLYVSGGVSTQQLIKIC